LESSDAFAIVLQRRCQALARKAGLHQTYADMIERGLDNPSLDAANALAEALEIPFANLIAETEIERPKQRNFSLSEIPYPHVFVAPCL
jgi:transcriptional regulator with XRE-family HTH domain